MTFLDNLFRTPSFKKICNTEIRTRLKKIKHKSEASYRFNGATTSPQLYPARLHYLMMSIQPGLDLAHLLEDVLKWWRNGGISRETRLEVSRMSDFGSHPLFHGVIGVIGHLLYYDQGVWVKDAMILICLHSTNHLLLQQHVGGNYLECPCNHLNLQTGFSNNLKHRSKHRRGSASTVQANNSEPTCASTVLP